MGTLLHVVFIALLGCSVEGFSCNSSDGSACPLTGRTHDVDVEIEEQPVSLLQTGPSMGSVKDFEKMGGIPDDNSKKAMLWNAQLLNKTLQKILGKGDTLVFPKKTFHMNIGIFASGLRNVKLVFDGTIKFNDDRADAPLAPNSKVMACITLDDAEDLVLTSSGIGTLDGNGKKWWGALNYAIWGENRSRLLYVSNSARLLVEHLHFKNSPWWTTNFHDIDQVEIRFCNVTAKYDEDATDHNERELQAFNTDGFDLSGSNVYVHDVNIWNQDDCVCVKGLHPLEGKRAKCSENWLVERVNASGLGLTIGSIGGSKGMPTCVRNITFRDSIMPNTVKGVYMKTRWPHEGETAIIEDVLYQNITINAPSQWAIWIGPAQQADSKNVCSLTWPELSPLATCPVTAKTTWRNITLRDIAIMNPAESPGVIIGSQENPMQSVVFDNVVVKGRKNGYALHPWGKDGYACYGVDNASVSKGGTSPEPPCFNGGPQCVPNGKCQDKSLMPCCTGKSHKTTRCFPYERCG